MKNRNNKITAVLFAVALALASTVQATPSPGGGPSTVKPPPGSTVRPPPLVANQDASENGEAYSERSSLPVVTIHSTDNVVRGKTGTFVLQMKPALMLGGTYVNFSLSGTAVNGVDYKLLASPAYISQSGYGTIQIETQADPRGSAFNRAYSVIVTLTSGAGYSIGKSSQAIMWIKPAPFVPPNW